MRQLMILALLAPVAWGQPGISARTPDVGGANLPAQQIGANDLIAVSVYDAPEFTRTVRVGEDGNIRLPMLQQLVHAEGQLPGQLETAIAAALKAEEILVDPYVTVTIVEYTTVLLAWQVPSRIRQPSRP